MTVSLQREVVTGMNLTVFSCGNSVYTNCECINGYAFSLTAPRVNCALLPVLCSGFSAPQGYCAHFDRTECLSPHKRTA